MLHRMFGLGVRWRLLLKNPSDGIELPKHVRPDIKCTNADGIRAVVSALVGMGVWRVAILIAAYTGMRRGEVLALRWEDYDGESRVLHVRRSIASVSGQGYIEKKPKTDRARRVPIPVALCRELDTHRQQTPYAQDSDYIFARPDGRPFPLQKFSENFSRVAKRAGVDITLHGLRHTQVTLLLSAGIPLQDVSARVGHTQTSTTLNIYAHATSTEQQRAADVIGSLLGDDDA